jgi:hypothetical protein
VAPKAVETGTPIVLLTSSKRSVEVKRRLSQTVCRRCPASHQLAGPDRTEGATHSYQLIELCRGSPEASGEKAANQGSVLQEVSVTEEPVADSFPGAVPHCLGRFGIGQ